MQLECNTRSVSLRRAIARVDPRYPVGRTRLETVGVILCAIIMALSSTEVVQSSLETLWLAATRGAHPPRSAPSPAVQLCGGGGAAGAIHRAE